MRVYAGLLVPEDNDTPVVIEEEQAATSVRSTKREPVTSDWLSKLLQHVSICLIVEVQIVLSVCLDASHT